jgi:hypothetical protein
MIVAQKLPQIYILYNDTAHEFKGDLTYEYLENSVMNKEFIETSSKNMLKKDEEGLTFKNVMYHP